MRRRRYYRIGARLQVPRIAHPLPSGYTMPFCAYKSLYRDGMGLLPSLKS